MRVFLAFTIWLVGTLSALAQCTSQWDTVSDHRSQIIASSNMSLSQGAYSFAFNGSTASNASSAFAFTSRPVSAGTDFLQFSFSSLQQVDGFQVIGDASAAQGTWQMQGSNDGQNWFTIAQVSIDASLGQQTWTNAYGYAIYRLLAVSGTTTNSEWVTEILFRRCEASAANAGPPGNPPPPPPPAASGRPLIIFIGAGQSNEEGQAPLPANQALSYPNRSSVHLFDLSGTWRAATDPVMDTTNSIWPAFNNTNTPAAGPQMGFGDELASINGLKTVQLGLFDIGLVPAAHGATTIEEWAQSSDSSTLYGAMIERAKAALAAAPPGSFIGGLIWWQGESNAASVTSAFGWWPQFSQLVANVRNDLASPTLPVVITAIGPDPSLSILPAWPVVQALGEQGIVPSNVARIETRDLPNNPGAADMGITTSVIIAGRRQAQAIKTLLPPWL